jgi:hypothetical protein
VTSRKAAVTPPWIARRSGLPITGVVEVEDGGQLVPAPVEADAEEAGVGDGIDKQAQRPVAALLDDLHGLGRAAAHGPPPPARR